MKSINSKTGLLLGSLLLLVNTLGAVSVTVTGVFDNPTPTRGTEYPYSFKGPQYAGLGTSRINLGAPSDFFEPRPDGGRYYATNEKGHWYMDYEGHTATTPTGTPVVLTTYARYLKDPSVLRDYGTWVDFASTPVDVKNKGERFVLGTITYRNGVTYNSVERYGFDFTVRTSSSQKDFNQTITLHMGLVSTPNERLDPATGIKVPIADSRETADYLYFADYPSFGSFRVMEEETVVVTILASFNSLHFEGFGEIVAGDGFLDASTEDALAVPEHLSSLVYLLTSLGFFICFRRK